MVKIFDSKAKTKNSKRRIKKSLIRENVEQRNNLGRENLSRLNPMTFSILSVYSSNNKSEWVSTVNKLVNETPWKLTDRWINSINKFVKETCESMVLDEPDIPVGVRCNIGPVEVKKIIPPKADSMYPSSAIIAVDENGWKWYFKTSKANKYSVGSLISLRATISAHKEGITFLKRAGSISIITIDV